VKIGNQSNRNNEGKFLFEVYTTNGWIISNSEKHWSHRIMKYNWNGK